MLKRKDPFKVLVFIALFTLIPLVSSADPWGSGLDALTPFLFSLLFLIISIIGFFRYYYLRSVGRPVRKITLIIYASIFFHFILFFNYLGYLVMQWDISKYGFWQAYLNNYLSVLKFNRLILFSHIACFFFIISNIGIVLFKMVKKKTSKKKVLKKSKY